MVEHNDFAEGGEYAVVYIRVSSANQDTHLSIAAQKEAILKAAEESGYSVVGWYIDGESAEGGDEGGDSEDGFACPALKRLLTDAQSPDDRCFDTVLLYKMSKLSRQIAEAHVIKRKLGALGVTVVSMTEPTSAERLFEPTFPIWLKSFLSNSSMVFQPLSNYGPFLRVSSYNNSMICHFAVICRRHHGGT